MYLEDGVYYLVGEGKKTLSGDISACFNLYSSPDLATWTPLGCILKNADVVAPPPFDKESVYRIERPKILKCPGATSKPYRLIHHCDTDGFAMRSIGVLSADAVTGPYTYMSPCFRPDGEDSYDMGTFLDDTANGGDGKVYLIRSVQNKYAGISAFTEACDGTTGIISSGPDMEGQVRRRARGGGAQWCGALLCEARHAVTTCHHLLSTHPPPGDHARQWHPLCRGLPPDRLGQQRGTVRDNHVQDLIQRPVGRQLQPVGLRHHLRLPEHLHLPL
jgi:hypothetical protein